MVLSSLLRSLIPSLCIEPIRTPPKEVVSFSCFPGMESARDVHPKASRRQPCARTQVLPSRSMFSLCQARLQSQMGVSRGVPAHKCVSFNPHNVFKFFNELPTFLNWEISHENKIWHYQTTLLTGLPSMRDWIADVLFR